MPSAQDPQALAAVSPKVVDNGGNFSGLLQPKHQAAYAAPVDNTAATNTSPYGYTQAQANAIIANLNAATAALIAAGLMKAS